MTGCVGALDGLLIEVRRPWLSESDNPDAYFSGHYSRYGVNCQGVCDAHYRFTYFVVAAPGRTGDLRALQGTSLQLKIAGLPFLCYIVGDAAYVCSDRLLTPFKGAQKENPQNSAFNYFLSQLRIRIECSFGLLTTKWSILRGNLTHVSQRKASAVIMTCAMLHNFVISVDGLDEDQAPQTIQPETLPGTNDPPRNEEGDPIGYFPNVAETEIDIELENQAGSSRIREAILNRIRSENLQRPFHNLLRNQGRAAEELQD